jgi:two-component system OmpR family response regulator
LRRALQRAAAPASLARKQQTDPPLSQRILLVDDDPGIRSVVADFLTRHDYVVQTAEDGAAMDRALAAEPFDLVVLDLMMPGEDGLAIARRLAAPGGPAIIMLSAMGEDTDRIVGLEVGADDYVAKPCNPRELLARIRAVLRRRADAAAPPNPGGTLAEFSGWRLDFLRRELRSPDGILINLSDGEFNLLRAFVENPRRALTREELLDLARGRGDTYDRAIDVQISRLRRKLDGAGADHGELIRTVRNEGYMFTANARRQ